MLHISVNSIGYLLILIDDEELANDSNLRYFFEGSKDDDLLKIMVEMLI